MVNRTTLAYRGGNRFCRNCGKEFEPTQIYCPDCGKRTAIKPRHKNT